MELETEHRDRRDQHDRSRRLHTGAGDQVDQAAGLVVIDESGCPLVAVEVALGAGVEDEHGGIARHRVAPAIEVPQGPVKDFGAMSVSLRARGHRVDEGIVEAVRLVAPALEGPETGEGVGDDPAPGGRVPHPLAPLAGQVPVVGDVVVVEAGVSGDVGQDARRRRHRPPGGLQVRHLVPVLLAQSGPLPGVAPGVGNDVIECRPARRPVGLPPRDQVGGGELAQAEEMIGHLARGECRSFFGQLLAPVDGDARQGGKTGHRRVVSGAEQGGAEPGEVADEGTGDLVGVDLVAGQQQGAGPTAQVPAGAGQLFVGGQEGVLTLAVQ